MISACLSFFLFLSFFAYFLACLHGPTYTILVTCFCRDCFLYIPHLFSGMGRFTDLRDMAFVHWRFYSLMYCLAMAIMAVCITRRTDYLNRQLFLPGDQQAAAVFLPGPSGIQYMSLAVKRLQSPLQLFFSTFYSKLFKLLSFLFRWRLFQRYHFLDCLDRVFDYLLIYGVLQSTYYGAKNV